MDQLLSTFLNCRPALRSDIVSTLASSKNWYNVAVKLSTQPGMVGRITTSFISRIEDAHRYNGAEQASLFINELSNLGVSVRQFIQALHASGLEVTSIAFEREVLNLASAVSASTSNSAASAGVTVNFIGQSPSPALQPQVAPSSGPAQINVAMPVPIPTAAPSDSRDRGTARTARRNRLVPAKELFDKGYHAVIQVPHINPNQLGETRIEFSGCLVVFVRDPENLDAEKAAAEEADILMHEDIADSGSDETKITQGYIRAEPYDYHGPDGEKVKSRSQQAQSRSSRRAQASK